MLQQTLFDKIWQDHLVVPESEYHPGLLYIDLHLLHEVTSPQAFQILRDRGLDVRRRKRCLATVDHSIPSLPADASGLLPYVSTKAKHQVAQLEKNCHNFGIRCLGIHDQNQGIVHVVGPELGATQPGKTIVCGDSHTSTHGAFGALAFGIGTTEVSHVLASQCLLQRKPKNFAINVHGALREGVSAKDLILYLISKYGVDCGNGSVIEYRGSAIEALSMDERMTVCNMSIEAGARAGMIAPDDTTFEYLYGRELAPSAKDWDESLSRWCLLKSDPDAAFDREVSVQAEDVEPMITYGTNPAMAIPLTETVPDGLGDPEVTKALDYMQLESGSSLVNQSIDVVFIGSCTNSRISDLKAAASILKGRKVAKHTRVLVVPGSKDVKREAEALGLDQVFKEAGAQWRQPSCSMCIAMNGDHLKPGELAVSTSNRNFQGRQGPQGKTLLASPITAAAAAIAGKVVDPRTL